MIYPGRGRIMNNHRCEPVVLSNRLFSTLKGLNWKHQLFNIQPHSGLSYILILSTRHYALTDSSGLVPGYLLLNPAGILFKGYSRIFKNITLYLVIDLPKYRKKPLPKY